MKQDVVQHDILPASYPNRVGDRAEGSSTRDADAELLAVLGYKQQYKREFRPVELFGVVFSLICIIPGLS
jgi:hypothetical protein